MADHLRPVPDPDHREEHDEKEVARATAYLMEHLRLIADLTGQPLRALVESKAFGIHVLAYMVTLRHTDSRVHERATGLFFRLLQRGAEERELVARTVGHLYLLAGPERPRPRLVKG
ncbi:hypothetical protein [Streptomyces sedi]|uniref:Uncharacterized protein n=1 Tax=Streptomyces sedi TaxID=555059 RepID=A0A5C4UQZ5_9ACTN|nr:hypothetical protein [Streptomyces sedi]TNM25898.1 hypothetical protein FH715_25355 [Streptomyces sedi]